MDEYKERNRKIQEEHLQGKNLYQLSKEYGVCVERIRTICKQQLRKEKRDKNELFVLLFMINCFCMFSDYVPLTLDEWIELDKKRRTTIPEPSEYRDNWMEDLDENP